MSEFVRWRDSGATYFFTLVTSHRRPILVTPLARRILREAMAIVRRQWPFDMFACVLLPDHLHCIWTLPPDDDDFPMRWSNVKRLFTQAWLEQGGREAKAPTVRDDKHERAVWQRRYWEHRIRDEAELLGYRDYIHLNPVKHGMVDDPRAWQWSSVHRHLTQGWLESDWTGWTPINVEGLGEP